MPCHLARDDELEARTPAPKRKSAGGQFPTEMPDFKADLTASKGKPKTFMAQLGKVTRPGCGKLTLKLSLVDPEPDEDDEEQREVQETEVRPCRVSNPLWVG
jgi:hypothetical protein